MSNMFMDYIVREITEATEAEEGLIIEEFFGSSVYPAPHKPSQVYNLS